MGSADLAGDICVVALGDLLVAIEPLVTPVTSTHRSQRPTTQPRV